jgi:hypothetical protein
MHAPVVFERINAVLCDLKDLAKDPDCLPAGARRDTHETIAADMNEFAAAADGYGLDPTPLYNFVTHWQSLLRLHPDDAICHLGEVPGDVLRKMGYTLHRLRGRLKSGRREPGQAAITELEGAETPPAGGGAESAEQQRRHCGRLPKADSEAKRADLLANIRQHPTLKDDPAALANMVDVSESTVRRWIKAEEAKYLASKPANPDRGED